ncbi:MAG: hypothetical protein MHM6MM_001597 [Cercozoa sp. M6MM]
MVNLRVQKKLAAKIAGCGERRIWLDPTEASEIAMASSRQSIKKLMKDGLIIKKAVAVHSRARAKARAEKLAKGRGKGAGNREGAATARMPTKVLFMRRMRVLRRLLKKYREQNKIDKHMHQELYLKVKGNVFKNKRVLQEEVFKRKAEKIRLDKLQEQARARKARAAAKRARREAAKAKREQE